MISMLLFRKKSILFVISISYEAFYTKNLDDLKMMIIIQLQV